jgi:hypothetical protein
MPIIGSAYIHWLCLCLYSAVQHFIAPIISHGEIGKMGEGISKSAVGVGAGAWGLLTLMSLSELGNWYLDLELKRKGDLRGEQ